MKKLKKIIITIVSIIFIIITGCAIYEISTVNNQYYISEKNLEIPIFVYHDIVNDKSEVYYDYMQTTKEVFENQMRGLKKIGYRFITFEDLKEYKEGKKELYKKSCIVTFDDGYEGVYKNAYPIANKYDIPFTMFVITDNIGNTGTITWKQAKEMNNSGLVTIASHSQNHVEFNKISTDDAINNVNKSYDEIEKLRTLGYVQNLTDNKINKSKNLDLSRLHRCYPLSDSTPKIVFKMMYRSIRYN